MHVLLCCTEKASDDFRCGWFDKVFRKLFYRKEVLSNLINFIGGKQNTLIVYYLYIVQSYMSTYIWIQKGILRDRALYSLYTNVVVSKLHLSTEAFFYV